MAGNPRSEDCVPTGLQEGNMLGREVAGRDWGSNGKLLGGCWDLLAGGPEKRSKKVLGLWEVALGIEVALTEKLRRGSTSPLSTGSTGWDLA